jgi:type 1 fimbria pilin
MLFRNLFLITLFSASAVCAASDGVIRFSGRVIESTCVLQSGTATLNSCSAHVLASTTVTTQIMKPNSSMLTWRANDTAKPDLPVKEWKVTGITYN